MPPLIDASVVGGSVVGGSVVGWNERVQEYWLHILDTKESCYWRVGCRKINVHIADRLSFCGPQVIFLYRGPKPNLLEESLND